MSWLNVNSGAIIGFSSIFVGILVVVLACIIYWYTHLTREVLKATNRPESVIYLQFYTDKLDSGELFSTIELCVKNVGHGVACNIHFEGNLSFTPDGSVPLHKIDILKNGISILLPGNEVYEIISSTRDHFHSYENQRSIADIDVIYENLNGMKYSNTFVLDFNYQNHSQHKET